MQPRARFRHHVAGAVRRNWHTPPVEHCSGGMPMLSIRSVMHRRESHEMPITLEGLKGELDDALRTLGKYHLSVRWEPGPQIARVGVCVDDYSWNVREEVLRRVLAVEQAHAAELAIEVDIVPLDNVNTTGFAEV